MSRARDEKGEKRQGSQKNKVVILVKGLMVGAAMCTVLLAGCAARQSVEGNAETNVWDQQKAETQAAVQTESLEVTQQESLQTKEESGKSDADNQIEKRIAQVDGGLDHTMILYSDGTVEGVGSNAKGQGDVYDWTDIVQISTMKNHTVGLRKNGTVVAAGENGDGQCNVTDWKNIVQVSAGEHHTVGLCADGTVVATGKNNYGECSVEKWQDIVAVGAAYSSTFGLCADGTVVVTGSSQTGKLSGWEDIQSISVSDSHIVGLRSNGTVLAAGSNNHGQCNLSDWKNIVQVSTGCAFTVGLKADGTVLVQGIDDTAQHDAEQWSNIAYIATGLEHIIGIQKDGTFVAAGANEEGQCEVLFFSVFAGGGTFDNREVSFGTDVIADPVVAEAYLSAIETLHQEETYCGAVGGFLFDLDQDQVKEMVLLYDLFLPYETTACRFFDVYDVENGQLITHLNTVRLGPGHVAGSDVWVGVEYDHGTPILTSYVRSGWTERGYYAYEAQYAVRRYECEAYSMIREMTVDVRDFENGYTITRIVDNHLLNEEEFRKEIGQYERICVNEIDEFYYLNCKRKMDGDEFEIMYSEEELVDLLHKMT